MKKSGAIVLVVISCMFLLLSCDSSGNTTYRWSANLIEAINAGETQQALDIIGEGVKCGYSMDSPGVPNSWVNRLLESVPDTPLASACRKGNVMVAGALLEAGALPDNPENLGWSAHMAVLMEPYKDSDLQILELLINAGADLSASEGDEYPVLQAVQRIPRKYLGTPDPISGSYYSEEYDAEVAEGISEVFCLIADNCDYRVTDGTGRNALHYAAIYGNEHLATVLLEAYDFDAAVKDANGKTAYDLAVENGYTQLAQLFQVNHYE